MKSKVPSMDASIIIRALVGEEVSGNKGGFIQGMPLQGLGLDKRR